MAAECTIVAPGNFPFRWIGDVQRLVQFAHYRPDHVRRTTAAFFAALGEERD